MDQEYLLNITKNALDFINKDPNAADGIQSILLGDRWLSLIILVLSINYILLVMYFFSKSAYGTGTLVAISIIGVPILALFRFGLLWFLRTTLPLEHKSDVLLTPKQLASVYGAIYCDVCKSVSCIYKCGSHPTLFKYGTPFLLICILLIIWYSTGYVLSAVLLNFGLYALWKAFNAIYLRATIVDL